jgi:hypothetical protein
MDMEVEIKQLGLLCWVVTWRADIGKTKQPRRHAAFVIDIPDRVNATRALRCCRCKRVNDCEHVWDVQRFRMGINQPKET